MTKILNIRRNTVLLAAINLTSLGVSLFLQSALGSDPLTILQEGLHNLLQVSVGRAALIYNAVILTAALCFSRELLGIGTIVYSLSVGFFIDFYCSGLSALELGNVLAVRVLCLLLGQVALSAGAALLIELKLGVNGLDALLLALERKTRIQYVYLRTAVDAVYALIGFLSGGIVGLGTVLSILSTGYLVSFFRRLSLRKHSGRHEN